MVPTHTSFIIHHLNTEIHTRKTFPRKKLLLYTNTATLEMVWTRKAFEDFFLISSQRKRKKKDKIGSLSMGKKFWGESSTEREAVVRQWPEGTIWLRWIFQHMNLADRKHSQNCPTRVWTSKNSGMPGNSQRHMPDTVCLPGACIFTMKTILCSRI